MGTPAQIRFHDPCEQDIIEAKGELIWMNQLSGAPITPVFGLKKIRRHQDVSQTPLQGGPSARHGTIPLVFAGSWMGNASSNDGSPRGLPSDPGGCGMKSTPRRIWPMAGGGDGGHRKGVHLAQHPDELAEGRQRHGDQLRATQGRDRRFLRGGIVTLLTRLHHEMAQQLA
ncbi:MAG: hypothetical protein QUV07_15145 [Cyanobium sp. CZS 25K]|nr:hypothetical protein [Cyanobium sp. CZS25K]